VNAVGVTYGSALQAAGEGQNEEIVHLLIENGANVDAVGRNYSSVLQGALTKGRKNIV
ncbi:hypothetical protein B0H19DRAFT_846812, partial [Mycena capillaripes]